MSTQITIAFGSCSDEDKEQFLWNDIIDEQPAIWIWLGDNIYGDTEDMTELRAKYDVQKKHPKYQQLVANTQVLGVWDDHDYGANDAGKHYHKKAESQQALLDFLDVPQNDIRRTRKGAYSSYTIEEDAIKVKIILLDARYFRDNLISKNGVNQSNVEGEILGEEQWTWLAAELSNSDADVHILGSGIQVIPEEHRFEKWANFPTERNRLFDLIKTLDVNLPIFISGDRHSGEISKIDWQGKIIYDITSSSLTHGRSSTAFEPNKYRIGKMVFVENYGILQIEKKPKVTVKVFLKSDNQVIQEEMMIRK